MRCIWQSILDQELTLLAQLAWHLRHAGVVPRGFKQFRVDAILVQEDRKTRAKSAGFSGTDPRPAQPAITLCPFPLPAPRLRRPRARQMR